ILQLFAAKLNFTEKESVRRAGRIPNKQFKLVGEERSAQGLVATAAAAVLPLHLNQPVFTAKSLVKVGAVRSNLGGAELEVALVGIFLTVGIEPGIQVRIGNGFFALVSDYIDHAIRAAHACSRAVGTGRLGFAAVLALINVADEGKLDV